MATTKNQRETLKAIIYILREAIAEAGENGIPSGHLYAMLMGRMTLHLYQSIIAGMVDAEVITNKGNLLKIKE